MACGRKEDAFYWDNGELLPAAAATPTSSMAHGATATMATSGCCTWGRGTTSRGWGGLYRETLCEVSASMKRHSISSTVVLIVSGFLMSFVAVISGAIPVGLIAGISIGLKHGPVVTDRWWLHVIWISSHMATGLAFSHFAWRAAKGMRHGLLPLVGLSIHLLST